MSILQVGFCKKLYNLGTKYYIRNMYREFEITGMACASCQHNVQKAVSKMRGVKKVNVNLVSSTMTLECDDKITAQDIINQVTSIGYGAIERKNQNLLNSDSKQQQLKKN